MSADSYSLSEARKLAEKLSENLPDSPKAADSDGETPKSGNSATSRLTPEQKAVLEPYDEFDDELEEGEIREEKEQKEDDQQPCDEHVLPELKASSSRSVSITNQENSTLHLSVYDEADGRRVYVHADSFNLPLADFRNYIQELLEDDIEILERNRQAQFEDIAKASLIAGAVIAIAIALWFNLLLQSLSRLS
jgi:hypothetical protein